jgi:hypothetical protein
VKLVHLVGFIIKKFVTMHGHTNVKRKKSVVEPGFKIPSVHPVASRYGDYAINAALSQFRNHENISKKSVNIFSLFLVSTITNLNVELNIGPPTVTFWGARWHNV